MSGTGSRENVFATRMALTNTKLRLKSAQTGHSLLAKKRDALTTRFRAILKKVDEVSLAHLLFLESYGHWARLSARWGRSCNLHPSQWLKSHMQRAIFHIWCKNRQSKLLSGSRPNKRTYLELFCRLLRPIVCQVRVCLVGLNQMYVHFNSQTSI